MMLVKYAVIFCNSTVLTSPRQVHPACLISVELPTYLSLCSTTVHFVFKILFVFLFASLSERADCVKCKKPIVARSSHLKPKERDKCKEKVSCKVAQSGNTSLAPKAPLLPSGTELSYPAHPQAAPTTPRRRLDDIYGWTRVSLFAPVHLISQRDE